MSARHHSSYSEFTLTVGGVFQPVRSIASIETLSRRSFSEGRPSVPELSPPSTGNQ
jgi:hypothetical protein